MKTPNYQLIEDCKSPDPIDFDQLRNDIVISRPFKSSFGRKSDLNEQIEMLEREFVGQSGLKFIHALLNVLLRRNISNEVIYQHFQILWDTQTDFLLDTLDSRWLISACDSICDHSKDPCEAQTAILLSLFVNTVKLSETERRLTNFPTYDLDKSKRQAHLFDGMTAFMPGGGDMPLNVLRRLEQTLQTTTLIGKIGHELVNRVLSADTVFSRFAKYQTKNVWCPYLKPYSTLHISSQGYKDQPVEVSPFEIGYILLNDTGRLGGSFHLGTINACTSIRLNLARRGLREIGWANDQAKFEKLLARVRGKDSIVVLNGEGTLHHGANRAVELLSMCIQAKKQGMRVAILNSVWQANPENMVSMARQLDLIFVRDTLSLKSLSAADCPVEVTPDVSIPIFLETMRDGEFKPPAHQISVIDSVITKVSETLINFAEEYNYKFYTMPGKALHSTRKAAASRAGPIWPRLLQLTDLMEAQAWVTGRFHGLIAALCAGIPVCAVQSNTFKIEGFLSDTGLTEYCLLDQEWLLKTNSQKHEKLIHRFEMQKSQEFILLRKEFLKTAETKINQMFDRVALLGGHQETVNRTV